jgi:hypothetical protein
MSFFNPLFWLTFQSANVDGLLGKIVLGFFLALFLLGIICRIVVIRRTHDRYVKWIGKRATVFFLTMGFFGIVLSFFSYERIQFFGARFWYPIWFLGFAIWLAVLLRFLFKRIPEIRAQNERDHAKSKYLPGRKH